MFKINELLSDVRLQTLKAAYQKDSNSKYIVVVVNSDKSINVEETINMHLWLEEIQYIVIPQTWTSADKQEYNVVHINQINVKTQRANPFSIGPVMPNTWLNDLSDERFLMLLLAQELGEISYTPSNQDIMDNIKPKLESIILTPFWAKIQKLVKFGQSYNPPNNQDEVNTRNVWNTVISRQFYIPGSSTPIKKQYGVKHYEWGSGRWTNEMTKLRHHITENTTIEMFLVVTDDILGNTNHVTKPLGNFVQVVHNVLIEAKLQSKLDDFANYFNYIQKVDSAFSQDKQSVYGSQVNINTGGGAYIGSTINTGGGDFIGGNKYSVG